MNLAKAETLQLLKVSCRAERVAMSMNLIRSSFMMSNTKTPYKLK